jgi:hypothetical protein
VFEGLGGGERAGGGNSAKNQKPSRQGSVLAGGMQWGDRFGVGYRAVEVVGCSIERRARGSTSGYPWSIPIRLNIFSYELSLIGTLLRWAPRDNCVAPG